MEAFTEKTSFSETELDEIYENGIVAQSSSLPHNSSNTLDESTITSHITTLKTSGVIPTITSDLDAYKIAIGKFITKSKEEYEHYNSRYKFSLQQLFSQVRSGYSSNTGDVQAAIDKYLKRAVKFNRTLNDLIQMINGISKDMRTVNAALKAEIENYNTKLQGQQAKLKNQSDIINSTQAASKIRKEMVKYTEEKGRHTDNLLKVYSFLNIVAFGLLIYIYRASE